MSSSSQTVWHGPSPDEPLAGGSGGGAAADGAGFRRDLGGIERAARRRDANAGFIRQDRGARHRRACHRRHAGEALSRLLRRLRQFGAMAGAALAPRSHPRHRRRLRVVSRDQRLHGARAGALQRTRGGVLDPGLSLSRHWAPTCAGSASSGRSASSCTRRGRIAAPWPRCRITPNSPTRCSPTISSASRPSRTGRISRTICRPSSA